MDPGQANASNNTIIKEIQVDANGEVVRIPLKQLTAMMLAGENVLVMKYLKMLPKDECVKTRARLIRALEEIQKKTKAGTVGRRAKPDGAPTSGSEKPSSKVSVGPGSVGKSSTRGKTRKRVEEKPMDLPENKQTIGSYTIEEELGKGMFGTVYKGVKTGVGSVVAIKQIDKEMVDKDKLPSIMREADVLAELHHPNIMSIYEVIQTKKNIFFILEYIDCGSLSKLVKAFGGLTELHASQIIAQCLDGLRYLHGKGIVHRDIKCDNILITSDGTIKLADFGTAKAEDKSKNFTVVGTPFWMAPEVIEMSGGGTISDIWSLGCTIVEMMTGEPPNFRLSTMQALFNIVEEDHPPVPKNLSEPLTHLLIKCCFVKNPKMRPSAEDLLGHPWIKLYESKPKPTYLQLKESLRKQYANDSKQPLTNNNASIGRGKGKMTAATFSLSGQTQEELEAILDEVTRERDSLKAENAELRKQIDALT